MSLCRVALILSVSLASGCSLLFSEGQGDDGLIATDGGRSIDAAVQEDAGCTSVSPHFDTCEFLEKDDGLPLVLNSAGRYLLNTNEQTLVGPSPETEIPMTGVRYTLSDGTVIFLVRTETLAISAETTLRAVGDVPLVIISRNSMQLRGSIDVSSANTQNCEPGLQGTGANPDACLPFHESTSGNNVGSGGGGGGFGSAGGSSFTDDGGGTGGAPAPLTSLRGGCNGGSAKLSTDGDVKGGLAGGALVLISLDVIDLFGSAKLLAGGAGGLGGPVESVPMSGSGGGSGGLIDLSAPEIHVRAGSHILANGGGGGGGVGILNNGPPQTPGRCGESARGQEIATGGQGGSATQDEFTGGNGGAGAGADEQASPGVPGGDSGSGGGGGGVGYIRVHGVLNAQGAAFISPQATFESF